MAILDLQFARKTMLSIEDYGNFINSVLKLNIPFTIVQYSLTEHGVILRISVPDEKTKGVIDILKKNGIRIENSKIKINEEKCVHCGECISLCAVGALYFDEDFRRNFNEKKCVGCKLCVDACPRDAISYEV